MRFRLTRPGVGVKYAHVLGNAIKIVASAQFVLSLQQKLLKVASSSLSELTLGVLASLSWTVSGYSDHWWHP